MNESPFNPVPSAVKPKRSLCLVVTISLIGVLCLCAVTPTIMVVADPFHWNLIPKLLGKTDDTAAQAIPQEAQIYAGLDLANADEKQINRIVETLSESLGGQRMTWDELLEQVFQQSQLGISVEDDIKSWIGQHAAIGIWSDSSDFSSANLVVAIETRDKAAADRFIEKLTQGQADITDYKDVQIYCAGASICLARSKQVVLLTNNTASMHAAVDTQSGTSFAETASYKKLTLKLPGNRLITLFITPEFMKQVMAGLPQAMSQVTSEMGQLPAGQLEQLEQNATLPEGFEGMALSLGIKGNDLQFDFAMLYDPAKMPAEMTKMIEEGKDVQPLARSFPEDSVVLVAASEMGLDQGLNLEALDQLSPGTSQQFDQALQQIEQGLGIKLEDDLLHYLDGGGGLAVFPTSQGPLAKQAGVGMVVALQSSQSGKIAQTIEKVKATLAEQGIEMNGSQASGVQFYELVAPLSSGQAPEPIFALGAGKNVFLAGTPLSSLEDYLAGKNTLADNADFKSLAKTLPAKSPALIYVDISTLLGLIREKAGSSGGAELDKAMAALEPFDKLIAGVGSENNVYIVRLVIRLK